VNENTEQIEAAARAAFSGPEIRVVSFSFEGRRYVAKRLTEQKKRRLAQTLFMRWLVRRITGQTLPIKTLALSEAAQSVNFEANRLQSLAAAGVRVPRVVLRTQDFFVLDDCGTVVATLLEDWPCATWRRELQQLATELGEFHAAGHWHGSAQIRNITLLDGKTYRIDFEERFGTALPLPVTQVHDLIVFLNSVALAGPIDEAETRLLLPMLLECYFSAQPDPEIRRLIARILPLMRSLSCLARPFQRWSRKGIRRLLLMVDLLATVNTPS